MYLVYLFTSIQNSLKRLKHNYGVAWIGAFSNIGHCYKLNNELNKTVLIFNKTTDQFTRGYFEKLIRIDLKIIIDPKII